MGYVPFPKLRQAFPWRRSIRLGKLEAQNCLVSASPRQRLLHLSEGPCLGELEVPFSPFPSINSRNHYSFVRTPIEVNDRHEIELVNDPNK